MVQVCKQNKRKVKEIIEPVLKKIEYLGSMNTKDLAASILKKIGNKDVAELQTQITHMTTYLRNKQV